MMLLISSAIRIQSLGLMKKKRRDCKALSQIHFHLSNNILQEVLQEKTAAALWIKLESICMSKDLTSKMHLKMKLFLHKL